MRDVEINFAAVLQFWQKWKLNPKPEARNPKPETRNPKPETLNPKPTPPPPRDPLRFLRAIQFLPLKEKSAGFKRVRGGRAFGIS